MEEGNLFLGQFLIWVILLLGQLNGYKSCTEKEREALLELKRYMVSTTTVRNDVLPTWTTWTNDTKSDCCGWKGVACNRTSRRVIELSFNSSLLNPLGESYPLNLSLLHPFEELRTMNLSWGRHSDDLPRSQFHGFFDDVEGYQSLRRLSKLEILDLSSNEFNNSIYPFLNAATSLRTLFLGSNEIDGPIPVKELKNLTNLELLDLSGNRFDSLVPELTHLKKLKVLDISHNYFSGSMEEIKVLTSLEQLNLGRNRFNGSIRELTHLKKLKALDLSDNQFSGSMEELKVLTSLERLNLGGNRFNSSIGELTILTNLKTLDLSYNDFSSSMVLQALKDMKSLELLNLRGNRFNGSMPVVCEMKNLQELDLSGNNFVGQVPLCLGNLKKLRVLDLSSNKISGSLPSSFSALESLEYLSLLDNNITGLFSLRPLTNLTKLKVFKLSPTSGMVQVDIQTTWQPKFQLSVLVLQFCGLEKIPSFLSYQKRFRLVDLSNNKLSGGTPTWLVMNNPELQSLLLQNNSFSIFHLPTIVMNNLKVLDFSANHIGGLLPDNTGRTLPNLEHMNGSNNGFHGHFPSSMGEMKNISFLDLSYNNLSGKLPTSFVTGCSSLMSLKLSHNRFSGHFLPERTSFTSMRELRIDNNLFSGEIGVGLRSLTMLGTLDMSNNCLTGTIPSWITELYFLEYLLLSNNFLRGTVAHPLLNIEYLDLSGNRFSGALPSRVSNDGTNSKQLFLHNNNITGSIPSTLLEAVEILDLRNNKLSGKIPQFVNLESISILLLKGNNLSGSIPKQLCALSKVRILDLSDNKLSGFIPSCLYNLSSELRREEEMGYQTYSRYSLNPYSDFHVFGLETYRSTFVVEWIAIPYNGYQDFEIKFTVKQRYESYIGGSYISEGVLGYMYGLDLSNNTLSGVIPAELGDFSNLRVLNLSHNFLSSSIPSSFSNLKAIESLDLSYNKLQGSIPHQLTSLVSLSAFIVSYNNLSGIIPRGRQFNTFDESRYLGNPLLCGPPTNRSCDATKSLEEEDNGREEEDDEVVLDMLVFYYSVGSTYLTALAGIVVLMCFDSPWRRAWLRIVDAFIASGKNVLF